MIIPIFFNIISVMTFLFLLFLSWVFSIESGLIAIIIFTIDLIYRIITLRNMLFDAKDKNMKLGIIDYLFVFTHRKLGGHVLFIPQWLIGLGLMIYLYIGNGYLI
jgi:hypothetical protein